MSPLTVCVCVCVCVCVSEIIHRTHSFILNESSDVGAGLVHSNTGVIAQDRHKLSQVSLGGRESRHGLFVGVQRVKRGVCGVV